MIWEDSEIVCGGLACDFKSFCEREFETRKIITSLLSVCDYSAHAHLHARARTIILKCTCVMCARACVRSFYLDESKQTGFVYSRRLVRCGGTLTLRV